MVYLNKIENNQWDGGRNGEGSGRGEGRKLIN